MTVPATRLVVSFRDADEPRALTSRFIAVAHRHPRGWSLSIPDAGMSEHVTFDGAAHTVTAKTGVTHLLIIWTNRGAS